MNFASLQKHIGSLSVVFIVSVFVTVAPVAHASLQCAWIDEYPLVSKPPIREQLDAHVKALPGIGNYQIRNIDGRFFIVTPEDEKCRETARCYYRLLDLRNGVVKDVFAFQGTGRMLVILSPTAVWSEPLQDDYSEMDFETRENTYLDLKLPRLGNTVLVVPESPEEIKKTQQICGAHSK